MDSLERSENGGEVCTLSLDRIFSVLANPSRRYTLSYLQDRSQPIPIADLATEIVAWKQNVSLDETSNDAIEQEYIGLHHIHLPKLEAANLVHVNRDRNTVLPTETVHSITQLLEIVIGER